MNDRGDIRRQVLRRAGLLGQQASELVRRAWMKFALFGARYSSNHGRVELAYKLRDPWRMESARERYRFQRTNALIAEQHGAVGSILEVGCGEGHQSTFLARACERLYGFDVSATAVARARARCPSATLATGDLFSAELRDAPARYDLVVACEVLYYMRDVARVIARMSEVGRSCLVTYYHGRTTEPLAAELARLPNTQTTTFSYGDTRWTAVWWSHDEL